MARVDIAMDHGQSQVTAQANFERAIAKAQAQFGRWIHRADWSETRDSVHMSGRGFNVELSYDEQKVYARGSVPLVFKLIEGPIKRFIVRALAQQ